VVVGSAPDAQAEGEPATGGLGEGGDLFGQQRRGIQQSEQHVGHQTDVGGRARRHRHRDDRVEALVDQPIDCGQTGEPALLGSPGPLCGQQTRHVGDMAG